MLIPDTLLKSKNYCTTKARFSLCFGLTSCFFCRLSSHTNLNKHEIHMIFKRLMNSFRASQFLTIDQDVSFSFLFNTYMSIQFDWGISFNVNKGNTLEASLFLFLKIKSKWLTQKSWVFFRYQFSIFFAKILGIGPWVSRMNWCKEHQCGSTYMVVRLSDITSKKGRKPKWCIFYPFLSLCWTSWWPLMP